MNLEQLKQAGFSDQEISEYQQTKAKELTAAGFSPKEINSYFGGSQPQEQSSLPSPGTPEMRQYVESTNPKPEVSQFAMQNPNTAAAIDILASVPETAASLATGAVSYPIAKVGGVLTAAYEGIKGNPEWGKSAKEVEERISRELTYQPISQTGQGAVALASKIMGIPTYPTRKVGEYLREQGMPNAAYLTETGGEFATSLLIPKIISRLRGESVQPNSAIDKTIDHGIDKGIAKGTRPAAGGQRNYSQMEKYNEKARMAVKAIIENKENLKLTDEFGEPAPQVLPKNLKQFSQALDQTKRQVFQEYDAMKTSAGQAGAVVDLMPIIKELVSVAGDKVMRDFSPNTIGLIRQRVVALNRRGVYTTAEAQEAIKHFNRTLDAFDNNPSYDTVSNAYVDAMIRNNLRKSLDDVIENTVGKGYQDLKNVYGSLKNLERDVSRRVVVDARKNAKGLIDFSDVFSGSEVVRGIIHTNPATIGAGVAAKTIASLYKYWNDPNTIIKGMFQKTEKLMSIPMPNARRIPTTPMGVAITGMGQQIESDEQGGQP